jgi:hypothetical protein
MNDPQTCRNSEECLSSCHSDPELGEGEESALRCEWKFYVYIMSSKSRRIYVGFNPTWEDLAEDWGKPLDPPPPKG